MIESTQSPIDSHKSIFRTEQLSMYNLQCAICNVQCAIKDQDQNQEHGSHGGTANTAKIKSFLANNNVQFAMYNLKIKIKIKIQIKIKIKSRTRTKLAKNTVEIN